MKRTASMSLDWERTGDDSYVAQLPPVPGYPGTWYAAVDNFTGILDEGGWYLTIFNRPNPTIYLYDIPGIEIHAKTAEELMNIVEEWLTPEMIADALQAKGYMPNVDVAAARKAEKRTASLDLDWKPNVDGDTYTAILPDVPGFPVQDPSNWSTHCAQVFQWPDGWHFQISLLIQRPQDLATMDNDDFGIPNGATAEEMMQAVDNLNMDDIVFVLRQWGFLPVEED